MRDLKIGQVQTYWREWTLETYNRDHSSKFLSKSWSQYACNIKYLNMEFVDPLVYTALQVG